MIATVAAVTIMYSVGEVGVDSGSGDCVGFAEAEGEGEADRIGDAEGEEDEVGVCDGFWDGGIDWLGDDEGVGEGDVEGGVLLSVTKGFMSG